MISLKTTKQTFEKKLVLLGFNYKINQYDQFITSLRRRVIYEIEISKDKKETLNNIFKNHLNVPFLILEDNTLISEISKLYLVELIQNGLLDLYFEEKSISFSKEEQEHAFLLEEIGTKSGRKRDIPRYFVNKYPFLIKNNNSYKLKLIQCINSNNIKLSDREKEDLLRAYDEYISEELNKLSNNIFGYSDSRNSINYSRNSIQYSG